MINVLMTLAILVALAIGLAALIPVLTLALAFVLVFGGFLIWLLPILIIAFSDRTTGGEKLAWILAIVFLSWFAWIFYFFFAPVFDRPRRPSYN